jgi:hypothetical protein
MGIVVAQRCPVYEQHAQAIEFIFGNGNTASKRSLTGFLAARNIVRIQTNIAATQIYDAPRRG